MNILYLMFDQLRFDYLGCAGHPTIRTRNIDALAARGVRFTNCYTQSPVCGPARMSAYTGRYVSSHGAQYNNSPLRVGELTLGDHLRAAGMGCWLIGKTHMAADAEGMARLGLSADSVIGARQAECGFDVWCRDDGLWAVGPDGAYDAKPSPYSAYLKDRGYPGDNPWADFANAADEAGSIASGWFMRNADKPANILPQDSETPWLTDQALAFMDQAKEPWCAHVSYIKPHWPYIAPAPYHDMYGAQDVIPAVRHSAELDDPHPIYAAFANSLIGQSFARDEVRQKVIPAYMGLISQCDDAVGRIIEHLQATGALEDTIIVLTSDHGDYLGDHWLGEKDLFHAPSVKIPLIIVDPRACADASRGTACDALSEAIDVTATLIEAAGARVPDHIVEGRSLMPYLHGQAPAKPREFVISEYDYSRHPAAIALNTAPRDARLIMVADHRWKLIHDQGGTRPMLFDLAHDPDELRDLGGDAEYANARAQMYDKLNAWARRTAQRVTVAETTILQERMHPRATGVVLGLYDGDEIPAAETAAYRGKVPPCDTH